MKTLSPQQAQSLVSRISEQPGFMDYALAGKRHRLITALPLKSWRIPQQQPAFSELILDMEQAWKGFATNNGQPTAGGLMGTLFYEAGNHTVPGFRGRAGTDSGDYGYAGLYLWQLILDTAGKQLPRLEFHPGCDAETRSQILELLDPTTIRSDRFAITRNFTPDRPADHYRAGVSEVLRYIHAGDCYQVNLSNKYTADYRGAPYRAFEALCQAIPVPHSGYVNAGDYQVLSISPELFLSIEQGRKVTSKPIKGTRPRDRASPERDREIAVALAGAEKDRAENLMIVDLIRNDLSRFCEPFSVSVPQLFSIESYENVHQLVSTVTGRLRADTGPLQAFLSAFPGGSITGAPKRRAMEIIDSLESHRRGPYCGSVFHRDFANNLHSNIAIRTLMTDANGQIHCWAGCGIVADSEPDDEYRESEDKVRKLMSVLEAL